MNNETKPTVLGLKKELEDFKKDIEEKQNKMLDILEDMSVAKSSPVVDEHIQQSGALAQPSTLPKEFQEVFEKYFDPADGFTAEYDFIEGQNFTINIPLRFSNALQAYLSFYKKDVRSRVLDPHNAVRSAEEYCRIVAKNINYNKDVKTK